jgi:hypothetical protein
MREVAAAVGWEGGGVEGERIEDSEMNQVLEDLGYRTHDTYSQVTRGIQANSGEVGCAQVRAATLLSSSFFNSGSFSHAPSLMTNPQPPPHRLFPPARDPRTN